LQDCVGDHRILAREAFLTCRATLWYQN